MKVIKTNKYKIAQSTIRFPYVETEEIPEEDEEVQSYTEEFETPDAPEDISPDVETFEIQNIPDVLEDNMEQEEVDPVTGPAFDSIQEADGYEALKERFNIPQAIGWAKRNNEVILIDYVTDSGVQISRMIEPHLEFTARTTGNHVLVTYDRTVNDVRAFILNNIQDYKFTGEQFDVKSKLQTRNNRRNLTRRNRRKRMRLIEKR